MLVFQIITKIISKIFLEGLKEHFKMHSEPIFYCVCCCCCSFCIEAHICLKHHILAKSLWALVFHRACQWTKKTSFVPVRQHGTYPWCFPPCNSTPSMFARKALNSFLFLLFDGSPCSAIKWTKGKWQKFTHTYTRKTNLASSHGLSVVEYPKMLCQQSYIYPSAVF